MLLFHDDSLTGNVGHLFDRDPLLPDFDSALESWTSQTQVFTCFIQQLLCAPGTLSVLRQAIQWAILKA